MFSNRSSRLVHQIQTWRRLVFPGMRQEGPGMTLQPEWLKTMLWKVPSFKQSLKGKYKS